MPTLFDLRKEHKHALDGAESLVQTAEAAGRELTASEQLDFNTRMRAAKSTAAEIRKLEAQNSIIKMVSPQGILLTEGGDGRRFQKPQTVHLSAAYADEFYEYISSNGKKIGAALYEGSSGAGGYAVPITVDDQIVPLAPTEFGVRSLANVMGTVMDIKLATQTAFGTAAYKAESGGSNNAFTESDPTLGQFTLSAFMGGITHTVSWELAQDVPAFQAFAVRDMILALQMYEENLFCNGTGTNQAQGLIGNVGAGVVEEPDTNGNLVTIPGILDLIGKLNGQYHSGAAFLMSRATSIILRKAQTQSNLFSPAWTREGTQDYLFGYPVAFSTSMPAAARGAAPVLFGNFKDGYIIGDRGGSGINVKVLDQVQALNGQIVLLAYRRMDGRVRRSEAIQQYNIAAS